MTERERRIYCTQCGSIVNAADKFCGVCGAAISPRATDAAPTQQIPTQVPPPPAALAPSRNLTPIIVLGFAVALVLVLTIGSVAGLAILRGTAETSEPASKQGNAAAGAADATRPTKATESTATKPADDESEVKKPNQAQQDESGTQKREPTAEEASGPAPGYNLIQTPDESLTAEVPPSWGVETGDDSEKNGGSGSWSYFAGEYLNSSITTAPSLEAWYSDVGSSGVYFVASKALAQEYTDYELTHSLFFETKSETCTKGPYKDYDRSPYSGKIQTWYDCGEDGATTFSVAAAPEGRECVVVLAARITSEAEREAIQQIFDTFEVDCGRVTSEPLPLPEGSASSSASPE